MMLATVVLLCSLAPTAIQADSLFPVEVGDRFGLFEETLAGLPSPRAAAFDSEGRLFLAGENRVDVFDQELQRTASWGKRGDGSGQLRRPGGLAVAANGAVYVSDSGNHRIQIFQPDGRWGGRFASRGSGEGQLLEPAGLAVSDERLFVADSGNNRIQVFDRLGQPVTRWSADGLMRPSGIARDEEGRLFVADTGNQRIVVLNPDGAVLVALGERGPFPGLFSEPQGVAVSRGRLYVADTDNHRIQVFDIQSVLRGETEPLYEWGKHALRPREGEGRLHYPDAVAVSPGGGQIVICESFVDRTQVFGPAVESVEVYAADPTVRTGISSHYGPAISALGPLLLLMEPESQTLQVMDVRGMAPLVITRFGGWGAAAGKFRDLAGVAFSPTGRLYGSDGDTARIQSWRLDYEPTGEAAFFPGASHLVQAVDLSALMESEELPLGTSPHVRPGALVVDKDGLIYVIDEVSASVLVFDARWRLQRRIGAGRLKRPLDLALLETFGEDSASGTSLPSGEHVAVADGDLGQVLLFGTRDEPEAILGAGLLVEPAGVTTDPEGRVLVTDRATHRVHVFDTRGAELTSWGKEGLGAGEFFKPRGIAMLPNGKILVLDHGNHRGQVFTESGEFVSAFGRRLYVNETRAAPGAEEVTEKEDS
ncbi:MAG: NHL repeat-containing protein [Planctomycetota bacterium]|nr:NHL repeat-containing protein [Planctomycetota bacterium]